MKIVKRDGKIVEYDLRLWIDEDATTAINGHKFEAKITSFATASIKKASGTICKRATTLHTEASR